MDGKMRVLLLVLALGHTWAAVNTSDCEQILPKRLSADNLDKVSQRLQGRHCTTKHGDTHRQL